MLKDIKRELLLNPQTIIDILEMYDFYKPHIQNNEIRCGYGEGHNPTAIRIRLNNNDNLFVKDFVRGLQYDLITYIIKVRNVSYSDVLKCIKLKFGITNFYEFSIRNSVFGGFYDNIKQKSSSLCAKTYDMNVLNEYHNVYSVRFLSDNISFSAQDYFHIGYDVISQRITIPIYSPLNELIGIKARAAWNVDDEELKYFYLLPCMMSSTLYGYCQNYEYLTNNDIYIFEAEKSVLQCYSYDIHNCVSLGSNSLSATQCKLIMELNPKRVIFMLDKGLDYENTRANITKLSAYSRMFDTHFFYWDWKNNVTLPDKASPSDCGKNTLKEVMNNEIIEVIT